MYTSALSALLFAASAFAVPVSESIIARTAPSTELTIRGWNATTFDCNWENPHNYGEMGPNEDTWGNPAGGSYNSYSLSRALATNETLQLFSTSAAGYCGTLLYPISGLSAGCYQTSGTETFSCIKMVSTQ
ncbi:MAG: hypothetical protein Q9161_008940 [Pseudevernia consocians]